jgi:hypothetical protein
MSGVHARSAFQSLSRALTDPNAKARYASNAVNAMPANVLLTKSVALP